MDDITNTKFADLYNKTGIPFQYWCWAILRKLKKYQGISEFSFTHPPSHGAQLGKSSSIDILALNDDSRRKPLDFGGLVLFFIECKRADPDIKKWIFSKDPEKYMISPTFFLKEIEIIQESKPPISMSLKSKIERVGNFPGLGYSSPGDLDYCLQCVEFNEALTHRNRNQEKMVYKPLLQVNHALSALFYKCHVYPLRIEELEFPEVRYMETNRLTLKEILFLPVVVTTADLFVADYDPEKVDMGNGKINETDIKFDGPKKWLTLEFPLPDYLKYSGEFLEPLLDIERSTTFIVNSNHWEEFLQKFTFQMH